MAWLVALALLGFIAVAGARLGGVYFEYFGVVSAMGGLEREYEMGGRGRVGLAENLMKRLRVNNVRSVNQDDISISRVPGGWNVRVTYEVRVPFVGHLDMVATFDREVHIEDSR